MRKLTLGLLVTCATMVCFGQAKNVRKAESTLNDNGDLMEAVALINEALNDEKTKEDPKTWFVRGNVYKAISEDSTGTISIEGDPLVIAVESYQKAQELSKDNSTYSVFADQKIGEIWAVNLNKGAEYYQNQDYENAITYFEKAMLAKPEDTTAYLYSGISAQSSGNYDVAEENYKKLLDLGYKNEDIYNFLINVNLTEKKNPDKALEYLQAAREAYPENNDFLKREIVILINEERSDEAENKLAEAIAADPDDPQLYYNRGYLYEQIGKNEDAVSSYQKALEINPEYFDANFNIAAYYYNQAAEILQKANDMDLKEYQEKGKQVEQQAQDFFKKALPYLEKARELEPDDVKVLSTLQTVYARLGMSDKAEEIEAKLEQM
jgi:tetratricopeptide (TPR) repeat protein